MTAHDYAVAGGHEALTRLLIERGAKVEPYTRLLCDQLDDWIQRAMKFVGTLPAK